MVADRTRAAALAALCSPVRQELVAELTDGPATVRELATRLGRSRQALHYHVNRLVRGGLIRATGTRGSGRAREQVYGVVPAAAAATRSGPEGFSPSERRATARATAAMLRLTQRDVEAALRLRPPARPAGPLQVVRGKARLDARSLARARRLLGQLMDVLRAAKGRHREAPLFAMTLVLTPVTDAAAPARRKAGS